MDISVTQFRARCLQLIRTVSAGGEPVNIKRRGRDVARLAPALSRGAASLKPWKRLRGSGELHTGPEEGLIRAEDFEAFR